MSQLFVWDPKGFSRNEAEKKFADALALQCETYHSAFGKQFNYRVESLENLLIGQISWDTGVMGWKSWISDEKIGGVAWAGVCEDFLSEDPDIDKLVDCIENNPERVKDWKGSHALCVWSNKKNRVYVTTGATQSQTLFYTEGANGFAIGSRANVILKLVGREPQLDYGEASLYLSWGYLIGDGTLFRNVRRLKSRRQVTLESDKQPAHKVYIGIGDYIKEKQDIYIDCKYEEKIDIVAEIMLQRVSRQLNHSSNIRIPITGGRDSRCIAAAAVKSGFDGITFTGGTENSKDVIVGKKVAEVLGLQHSFHRQSRDESLQIVMSNLTRLELYSNLSEGIETLRHSLSYQDFFESKFPISNVITQDFHGLGASILKGNYYKYGIGIKSDSGSIHTRLHRMMNKEISFDELAKERLQESLSEIDTTIKAINGHKNQWFDLFDWQKRTLQWGQDMMSVKEMMTWRWNPFIDQDITQISWSLPFKTKSSKSFIESVTLRIAPELRNTKYDKGNSKLERMRNFFEGAMKKFNVSKNNPKDPFLVEFWELILFEIYKEHWPKLISKDYVKNLVRQNPDSELLWNILTVEVFAKENL